MNTYLPFADLDKSLSALDEKRLNRQRSDVVTILKGCAEPPPVNGKEHNAIRMWRGNELFLVRYGIMACLEWQVRGNNDATMTKIQALSAEFDVESNEEPEWFGDEDFHRSHRSHLIKLRPSFYQEKFPTTPDDLPLIWPRSPRQLKIRPEQREMIRRYKRAEKTLNAWNKAKMDALSYALEHRLNPATGDTVSLEDLSEEMEELERLVNIMEQEDPNSAVS